MEAAQRFARHALKLPVGRINYFQGLLRRLGSIGLAHRQSIRHPAA